MARTINIHESEKELQRILTRLLQSGNINFILGSGASSPAISTSGSIEAELKTLFQKNKDVEAQQKVYAFLSALQMPNNLLLKIEELRSPGAKLDDETSRTVSAINTTLENYVEFIRTIELILSERKNNLFPKQANVFTTNYDLFIEKAAERFPVLKLVDGFARTPNLSSRHLFSSQVFYNSTFNTGNLYDYKSEIPTINLVKIHGSLSWKRQSEEIVFEVAPKDPVKDTKDSSQVSAYCQSFALVLPQKGKFRETIMDRTHCCPAEKLST